MGEPSEAPFSLDQLVIEQANESDHPAILALFREGLGEGQVPINDTGADIENLHEGYFADEGASGFWVGRHNGLVVGMIGVQRTSSNVAEMRRLRVHTDFRRLGIGTRLMERAISFCHEHGYLKVVLDVRIEREPAIKLFEKFGFALSRTREIDGRRMLDFYIDLYREPEG
jgi:ribosomal protein S18 acetylase RimI-like enzyme